MYAARQNNDGGADGCNPKKGVVADEIDQHTQRTEVIEGNASARIKRGQPQPGRQKRDVFGRDGKSHATFRWKSALALVRSEGDCRRQTARIASAFGTGATSALTLRMYIVVVRAWMKRAPTMAPARSNRSEERRVG